jgi:transposase
MTVTCGIDWAEAHHDVALVDETGARVANLRIDTGVKGFGELMAMLVDRAEQPLTVPVAIETDKGLLVAAQRAAGMVVYAINPRAVARYRERHGQAGGKSDPGDAVVLADILRTDRDRHRSLPRLSDEALAVKALARQHQEAIWARQEVVNRLRSLLIEFYPNALAAFPNLTHKAALEILAAAPTPEAGSKLATRRVITLLRRCGRGHRPDLAERIMTALRTPALHQPERVEAPLGHVVARLVATISVMQAGIAELENVMTAEFDAHPDAAIFTPAPGLGPVLAARVLGEIGDDRARFLAAQNLRCFAGTAPITRASGRTKVVQTRHIRNRRLADACHWWAFAAITKSPGARAHYDRRRAAGDSHNAALRHLANTLLGRLWWCWQNHQPWNEETAWANIALAESVFGLYKAELITSQGPWRTVEDVELATLSWVYWWNTGRLHSAIGEFPPAEYEAAYYA